MAVGAASNAANSAASVSSSLATSVSASAGLATATGAGVSVSTAVAAVSSYFYRIAAFCIVARLLYETLRVLISITPDAASSHAFRFL